MSRHTENKIILLVRRTRLDELVARFNTEAQARFYIEHLAADFSDYQHEDRVYKLAKREVESILARHGRVHMVDRQYLPNFLFGSEDTVVALGQDGLVANIMKYLNGQCLLGVNPDTARYEGTPLPFSVRDIDRLMPEVFRNLRPTRPVTLAEARLNTGQSIIGVNDIFIGPRTHASARYHLHCVRSLHHWHPPVLRLSRGNPIFCIFR